MTRSVYESARNTAGSTSADELAPAVLLLLAVADGPAPPWSLLTAASTLLARQVGPPALEPLFRSGLLRHENGAITTHDDASSTRVLEHADPRRLVQAHLAWRHALVEDELARARHTALAWMQPDEARARAAGETAIRLQAAARQEAAVEMFAQAARLSVSPGARAQLLTRGAACAFAAGLWSSGAELLTRARALDPPAGVRRIGDLVESAFSGGRGHNWIDHLEVARVLLRWQQSAAAFGVLAAAPGAGWLTPDLDQVASFLGHGDREVLDGLVLLRGGHMSRCLPKLRTAADQMGAAGEWGAASLAYTLVAEAAVCLGQVSTGVQTLERLQGIRLDHPAVTSTEHANLVEALLAARQGRGDDTEVAWTLRRATLSADRTERDRAELVCAVDLVAGERWDDAFDLLAGLVDGAGPELVAWGVLSHLADAAQHTGQVDLARRLVSDLSQVGGLFEGDIALAELLYATAILSDPDRADACFRTLLSHHPARWPWLGARARLAYGQHLRRTRQVGAARGHLVTAQRLFAAMDVPAWERRAAGELRAAGVRNETREHPAAVTDLPLSAQELQIARMAARGLSNREIGQSLFLSPRTIGSHLYRIFPKLNVTSRVQLSDVLTGGQRYESRGA